MINEKEIICKNCGDGYFHVLYDLALGRIQGTQIHWEMLRCMSCGQIQVDRTEWNGKD